MRYQEILVEANVIEKIKNDNKMIKRLAIAMRHDHTLPLNVLAKLGPKPTDIALAQAFSELLDKTLSSTSYGDLSRSGKFDEWLLRQYINGIADYEDINGEGGEALSAYNALSIRGMLYPQDQDFNRFPTISSLQRAMRKNEYQRELQRLKDQETIEKHKREKREVVVYEDDRFWAAVLLNYGACYTLNNSFGYRANFCTGSSTGLNWFNRYAPDGMILAVVDKDNINDADGKWQIHAGTNQFVNADQDNRYNPDRNAGKFNKLFPGLFTQVTQGIVNHGEEIKDLSKNLVQGGYDVSKEVENLKRHFPAAYVQQDRNDEQNR